MLLWSIAIIEIFPNTREKLSLQYNALTYTHYAIGENFLVVVISLFNVINIK